MGFFLINQFILYSFYISDSTSLAAGQNSNFSIERQNTWVKNPGILALHCHFAALLFFFPSLRSEWGTALCNNLEKSHKKVEFSGAEQGRSRVPQSNPAPLGSGQELTENPWNNWNCNIRTSLWRLSPSAEINWFSVKFHRVYTQTPTWENKTGWKSHSFITHSFITTSHTGEVKEFQINKPTKQGSWFVQGPVNLRGKFGWKSPQFGPVQGGGTSCPLANPQHSLRRKSSQLSK